MADTIARRSEHVKPCYQGVIRDFGNGQVECTAWLIKHPPHPLHVELAEAKARGIPLDAEYAARKKALADREPAPVVADSADRTENVERSVRRARQNVRWRIKGQRLDHMLTLTIRENMIDRERLKVCWARFVRSVKDRNGDQEWPYVAVVEEQERGALHIHCAVKGRQDVNKLRGLWWKALGAVVSWRRGKPECLGDQSPGNIDVSAGKRGKKYRPRHLAGYLSKYLDKAMHLVELGAKRYWAPKGFVCPKESFYLKAYTLEGALLEVVERVEKITGRVFSPWKSETWDCIFLSS